VSTKLVNLSRTSLTFNLTREVAPLRRVYTRTRIEKTGETHREERRIVIPDSVTLLHGESRGGFHPSVVRCPEVAALIAAKKLRAEDEIESSDSPATGTTNDDAASRRKDAPGKGDRRQA